MGLFGGLLGKKPEMAREERANVLGAMLKKVDAGNSVTLGLLVARSIGLGIAATDDRVISILNDIKLYGLSAGKDARVEDWWAQAAPEARVKILETTIVWLNSK